MTEINLIKWLSDWYSSNCDDYWEHDYGVKIETLDNPGWSIEIDIEGTDVVVKNQSFKSPEYNSTTDWYCYKVENGRYEASGDPSKLELLICTFKDLVENSAEETEPVR
jgi:hypothetical protein